MYKIDEKLPVFRRCCFCTPLRYGLLFWGYFKLVLSSFLLFVIVNGIIYAVGANDNVDKIPLLQIDLLLITLVLVITDNVLGVIFIVGCHKKNVKPLMLYYYFSIFLLTLLLAWFFYNIFISIYDLSNLTDNYTWRDIIGEVVYCLPEFCYVAIQAYITLLVRSEVIKLKDGSQFKYESNTTQIEGQFTVNVEKTEKVKNIDAGDIN